jgi:hypothetical protein
MFDVWSILALVGGGVVLALLCVMVGAFIMFRGKSPVAGGFITGAVPKGEVYSIPDSIDAPDFPEDPEARVMAKTEQFLKALGGKS